MFKLQVAFGNATTEKEQFVIYISIYSRIEQVDKKKN